MTLSSTLHAVLPSRESVVSTAPFLAALLAPAATLFDIPALSQRWYSFDGQELSDPPASLVLSAISLAFSILANTLLVVRFAIDNPRRWRVAIRISLLSWFLKTAVGFSNLIVFGATRRNGPGYVYIEGFWCAIISVVLSGIVTVLLSAQYMLNTHDRPEGSVNLDCRMLIISEMILFGVTALEALIFCKVEGWSYLDGLYFAVVSLLTIGFGNLVPTKTSTKILLFPFSIMGIALLSNQVTLIASVSSRMTQRYRQRLNYGPALHRKLTRQLTLLGNKVDEIRGVDKKSGSGEMASPAATQEEDDLMREVHRLRHIHSMHEGAREMFQFLFSLVLLVVFWFVTGAIFQAIEGWSFGNAMYFSYVFFLTIGYGDYAPNTPAGKTLFVFWSMLAVPIMTNFVVQTIQTIVSRISTLLSNRARERKSEWYDYVATYFVPHTDLVDQIRQDIDNATELEQEKDDLGKEQQKHKTSDAGNNMSVGNEKGSYTNSTVPSPPPTSSSIERVQKALLADESDTVTVSRADLIGALEQSILLEAECRSMLIDQMRTGSAQWLLLKADTNLQQQNNPLVNNANLQRHLSRKAELQKGKEQDATANKEGDDHAAVKELQHMSNQTMIERVDSYRQTYARFLVLAGRLLDLHGGQLFEWEREIEAQGHHLGE